MIKEDIKADLTQKLTFRKVYKRCGSLADLDHPMRLEWSELHDARKKLLNESEDLLQRAITDGRDLSDDENKAYDFAKSLLDEIQSEFEHREKTGDRSPRDPNAIERKMYFPNTANKAEKSPINSRTYRGMFYGDEKASLDNGEFKSLDDFLMTLASGRSDPRLTNLEKRTFAEVSGVTGGFSVPEEYASWLMDKSLEVEIVRARATVYPMKSAELHIPAWDNDEHQSNLYGGFSGEWLSEGASATTQTGKLRSMTLKAKKLAIYTEASREVLADGLSFEVQLGRALVKSIGFYLDTAFLSGSGVGRPQGVLNSPSIVKVTRTGATSIVWTDIYTMYSRMHPACYDNAVWLANHGTLPRLMNLKDDSSNLVFIPGQFMGISGPVPASIFGKPILFTEKLPTLGSEGDLMLCDLSQYGVGLREDVVIDRSNAPGWTRDVESFRVILRADGQALWDKAITPADGSTNTLSWAVCLTT